MQYVKRFLPAFLLFNLIFSLKARHSFDSGKLDDYLKTLSKNDQAMLSVHIARDDQISIAVTINAVNYSFNNILIGILSIPNNLPYDIPDFEALDELNNKLDFNQYCGTFSSSALPLEIM